MDDFGLPDFTNVDPRGLEVEIREKLDEYRSLLESIASSADPATVDNTLVPFEVEAQSLEAAVNVLHTFAASVGGDEWEEVEARLSPLLAEHNNDIYLNPRLYERFSVLASSELDPETAWCVHEHIKSFRAHGCHLEAPVHERLRAINKEIAQLTTQFGQLALKAQTAGAVALTEEEVEGLSESQKAGLAADAEANPELSRGKPYLVLLDLPTQQPIQSSLSRPDVRQRILEASITRGDGHDPNTDTRAIALKLVYLRAELAQLLGYPTYAQYVAAQGTAGSTRAIRDLIEPMIEPTQRNADAERETLEAYMGELIAPSDWSYAQDAVARERFHFDNAALAPYLELMNVIERGVFYAANRLYGLTFHERTDLRGYAEGVRVWEVRREDGPTLGLFLGDYFARSGKRGGAWMHSIRESSRRGGGRAIVCNNLNITRPSEGEPALLTWDEVETAFHEFGHALHGLLSDVEWPSACGTRVPQDFVEYPSQVNEMWAKHPDVLANFARHYATQEPLPEELAASLSTSDGFGAGFHMSEMLQAVLLDQGWHDRTLADLPESPNAVEEFEKATLERAGIASPWIAPRYRSAYFAHIFSGGYSARYYSYLWSEALDADTVEWFRTVAAKSDDGGLNREAGARLEEEVLSRGNSRNPLEGFERLLGRPVDTKALLRRNRLL